MASRWPRFSPTSGTVGGTLRRRFHSPEIVHCRICTKPSTRPCPCYPTYSGTLGKACAKAAARYQGTMGWFQCDAHSSTHRMQETRARRDRGDDTAHMVIDPPRSAPRPLLDRSRDEHGSLGDDAP